MAKKTDNQKYIYIGVIAVLIIVLGFVFISNQQKNQNTNTYTPPVNNPSNNQQNTQINPPSPQKLSPSITSFSAECCSDSLANGLVLYGNQISSKGLVIHDTDGEHANFFEFGLSFSGFSKSDVSDIKAYCNNGGKIQYPDLNSIKDADKIIVLDYNKNVEWTSTDECVVILTFKNGESFTKDFTIKMIGSKYS